MSDSWLSQYNRSAATSRSSLSGIQYSSHIRRELSVSEPWASDYGETDDSAASSQFSC
ncbi:hypothetical protein INS49_014087 [Diaporthe citri]|uniref:uncharacterized protein n=1 Tax=Diaporthe citri TaxID=83186 RepID=UPI001C8091A4|nr:uncharacterized protein INS49_014087 [Diaporthe citri]KAG6358203.1 hypothetical protein INS49_014087 [Diaporthe citri]